MQRISNPYDPEISKCFGCSDSNPIGLKLDFFEDGDIFGATWVPTPDYSGFINLLHGGIAATLIDEAGAWCVSVKCGTACVTSELKIRYLKPVYISRGTIRVTCRITEDTERLTVVECKLHDGEGNVCVTGEGHFFKYPEEIARKKFYYPGKDAFYTDK